MTQSKQDLIQARLEVTTEQAEAALAAIGELAEDLSRLEAAALPEEAARVRNLIALATAAGINIDGILADLKSAASAGEGL